MLAELPFSVLIYLNTVYTNLFHMLFCRSKEFLKLHNKTEETIFEWNVMLR